MAQRFSVHFPVTVLVATALALGCSRAPYDGQTPAHASSIVLPESMTIADVPAAADAGTHSAATGPAMTSAGESAKLRGLHFAWKPSRARPSEYAMQDEKDQHVIHFMRGVERGKTYPVVIAFHGQPRRGQAPRSYAFPHTIYNVAHALVDSGELPPFVLVTPVFRFEGQNWPHFDVSEFVSELKRILATEGISTGLLYFVGHSGAAGCGGDGLNHVADASPSGVGFFDTCVGSGFLQAVLELQQRHVPVLIAHSVETAGFQPREPTEYESEFDFGKVYSKVGLAPTSCPERVPDAPLRKLPYRCAANKDSTTRAFVVDTGKGESAHEALVPVAFRYFLREYVHAGARGVH